MNWPTWLPVGRLLEPIVCLRSCSFRRRARVLGVRAICTLPSPRLSSRLLLKYARFECVLESDHVRLMCLNIWNFRTDFWFFFFPLRIFKTKIGIRPVIPRADDCHFIDCPPLPPPSSFHRFLSAAPVHLFISLSPLHSCQLDFCR